MEEDIKILETVVNYRKIDGIYSTNEVVFKAIEHLIKTYKEKDKDNNDLRRLYRRTSEKLRENGKEELADYFLAQINEVPTFTINDDIDYYTEYYKFINGEIFSVKQLKYIEENQKKYFINKKAVKEKIKHYEELQNNYIKKYDEVNNVLQTMINVLQELLEEQ